MNINNNLKNELEITLGDEINNELKIKLGTLLWFRMFNEVNELDIEVLYRTLVYPYIK